MLYSLILFPSSFKTLKHSLIYRLAGLLWVTCVGVIDHLFKLKVHISLLIFSKISLGVEGCNNKGTLFLSQVYLYRCELYQCQFVCM